MGKTESTRLWAELDPKRQRKANIEGLRLQHQQPHALAMSERTLCVRPDTALAAALITLLRCLVAGALTRACLAAMGAQVAPWLLSPMHRTSKAKFEEH